MLKTTVFARSPKLSVVNIPMGDLLGILSKFPFHCFTISEVKLSCRNSIHGFDYPATPRKISENVGSGTGSTRPLDESH